MTFKKLLRTIGLWFAGWAISIGVAVAMATCVALAVMIVLVTVGTVFALDIPYKHIAVLAEIAGLVVIWILTAARGRIRIKPPQKEAS